MGRVGEVLAEAYTAPASRAALDMLYALVNLGYEVVYSPAVGYDAAVHRHTAT